MYVSDIHYKTHLHYIKCKLSMCIFKDTPVATDFSNLMLNKKAIIKVF